MANPPAPPCASDTTRARTMGYLGHFEVLPTEIITDILAYLPINGLWAAARVSRQFYAIAWSAGLFIHRDMHFTFYRCLVPALAVFKDVLEHTKRKDLRLSLTLWCFPASDGNAILTPSTDKTSHPAGDELFSLISDALPFLVYLCIQAPDYIRPRLEGALRFPAPRLLELEINHTAHGTRRPAPLPCDLFGGSAPQLRSVKLGDVTLPDTPVPALRSVSHAVIMHETVVPLIPICLHFPRLTSLHLACIEWGDSEVILPDRLDIAGLPLRALSIDDLENYSTTPLLDVIERGVDLSTIPVVEISGWDIRWDEKLLATDNAPLSMRVGTIGNRKQTLRLIAVPAHRRWRRVYNVGHFGWSAPLPIGGLPALSARLVYLRIDGGMVRNLVVLEHPFPALRNLHVDIKAEDHLYLMWALREYGPTAPSRFQPSALDAPCPYPALEVIVFFALDVPIVHADSRCASNVAYALGQSRRPKAERAALELVGFEFEQPVAQPLLDQTVSEIRQYPFAGRGSRKDYDEGLWEPVIYSDLRCAYTY